MTAIVLDANMIASLVLPLPYSHQSTAKFIAWKQEGYKFAAPSLWAHEVATVLRKATAAGFLTNERLEPILGEIWHIEIQEVPASKEMIQISIEWAARIGQSKCYDSAYLAAAEMMQAEFWTADQRLYRAARGLGVDWVHSIRSD